MEQPFSVGDRHIAQIRSNGRMAWQVATGVQPAQPDRNADRPVEERHRPQSQIPQLLQADHGDPTRPESPEHNDRTRTACVRTHRLTLRLGERANSISTPIHATTLLGRGSTMSSSKRWIGCAGITTNDCWSRSAISLRRSLSRCTIRISCPAFRAANNQVIGTPEMYETAVGRDNGIESVKTNAPTAETDDQT